MYVVKPEILDPVELNAIQNIYFYRKRGKPQYNDILCQENEESLYLHLNLNSVYSFSSQWLSALLSPFPGAHVFDCVSVRWPKDNLGP